MIHLTLIGYYAGATFCGDRRNETDRYVHACLTAESTLTSPDLCRECKAAWDSTEETAA